MTETTLQTPSREDQQWPAPDNPHGQPAHEPSAR